MIDEVHLQTIARIYNGILLLDFYQITKFDFPYEVG